VECLFQRPFNGDYVVLFHLLVPPFKARAGPVMPDGWNTTRQAVKACQ